MSFPASPHLEANCFVFFGGQMYLLLPMAFPASPIRRPAVFIVSSSWWPDVFTAYQWPFLPQLFGGQMHLLFLYSGGQMYSLLPDGLPASPIWRPDVFIVSSFWLTDVFIASQ